MTTPSTPPPLTFGERSPFNREGILWGSGGTLLLSIGMLFTGDPVAIVFGLLLLALGVATLVLSRVGAVDWYEIPTPQRYIVGTGAAAGLLALAIFLGRIVLVAWIVQRFID